MGLLSREKGKHAVAQKTVARFKRRRGKGIKHTSGDEEKATKQQCAFVTAVSEE